jgi:hypothetical protein
MNYNVEKRIESSAWIITIILLLKFVSKKRIREAIVIFFFKQCITWILGLLVVEKGWIRYPARLFFRNATKSSFTFEYFVYPSLCVLFNLYYPEKRNRLIKSIYLLLHTSIIAGFEVFALKYTRLITYTGWRWYWTFISISFTYLLSHLFHGWFFKKGKNING